MCPKINYKKLVRDGEYDSLSVPSVLNALRVAKSVKKIRKEVDGGK